jgi:hypothetical protein
MKRAHARWVSLVLTSAWVVGCGEGAQPDPAPPPAPVVVAPPAPAVPVAAPVAKEKAPPKFGQAVMPDLPKSGQGQAEVKDLPVIGSVTVTITWGDLERSDDEVKVPVEVTYGWITLVKGTLTCNAKGCKLDATTIKYLKGPISVDGAIALDDAGGGEMKATVTDGDGKVVGKYVIGFNAAGDFNVFYQNGDGSPGAKGGSGSLTPPE